MSNVIDLKTGKSVQSITTEVSKPEYSERELERFTALRDLIEAEIEAHDKAWLESFECYGYEDCAFTDDDELLSNFESNYSGPSIGLIDFDHLTSAEIIAAVPKAVLVAKVGEYSSLQPDQSYYVQHNEIGSVQIGETEHQIDVDESVPAIALALANMADADIKRFNQWCYAHLSRGHFCVYGHPCERLILKLDAEAFLKDETIKAALALTHEA